MFFGRYVFKIRVVGVFAINIISGYARKELLNNDPHAHSLSCALPSHDTNRTCKTNGMV